MMAKITISHYVRGKEKSVSASIDTNILDMARRKNSISRKIISEIIVSLWNEIGSEKNEQIREDKRKDVTRHQG